MALALHTTLRNNRADEIAAFVSTSAKLRIYTAAYATLLVEHICDASAFAPAASAGVVTVNPIDDGVAVATGDAALARLYKSDGTTLVMNGISVSDSGGSGQLKMLQTGTHITSGQTVVVDSLTITEGNA